MAVDIVMPNMGFDTQEARLLEWRKQPGDSVQRGEVIAVIESDKANVELESVASGVLLELLVPADSEVKVGAIIARVGEAREVSHASASTVQRIAPVTAPAPTQKQAQAAQDISPIARRIAQENNIDLKTVAGSGRGGRIMRQDVEALVQTRPAATLIQALPKVRKAAREAGIDLKQVRGTGHTGIITLQDLEAHQTRLRVPEIETEPQEEKVELPVPEGAREINLSRMRQLIGKRLGKSKRKAPHFYVTGEFDLETALKRLPDGVRVNDLIQYFTVQTLLRVPELNATYQEKRLFHHSSVDLCVAIALDNGLLTPVITGAERYSLLGLAQESRALIARARENRLHFNDLQNGSPQQPVHIGWRGRHNHQQARMLHQPRLSAGGMLRAETRPCALFSPNRQRQDELPIAHITIFGDLVDNLIHCYRNKIGEHQFRYRAQSRNRCSQRRANECLLRDRGIPHTV